MKKNDNEIAMFMYDGDGNQVKVTVGSGLSSTTRRSRGCPQFVNQSGPECYMAALAELHDATKMDKDLGNG